MKISRISMIFGSLLLLSLFVFPIWNISLEAPQYPTPLGMDIYINDFADENPFDIKNINLMNHYVGMQYIPESIPEFKVFPIVVLTMCVLGVIIGLFMNYKWFLGWLILLILLSFAGVYDFYLWEHDYGHNLDPKAIMKFTNPDGTIMGFQPPLFGSKDILNFRAHSYPQVGVYLLVLGMAVCFYAFLKGKKDGLTNTFKKGKNANAIMLLLISSLFFISCTSEPVPINFGEDQCYYCQMTIVDKSHAAEIVTDKGKTRKFDATECMMNHLKKAETNSIKHYLSTDFNNPGILIDATNATFLISENIPSPMGANLSAFASPNTAAKFQEKEGGKLYTWEELKERFQQ